MNINFTEVNNKKCVITVTYEEGEQFTGTDTIKVAGLPIYDKPEGPEEKAEYRKDIKGRINKAVAKHLTKKIEKNRVPSNVLSGLIGYERNVKNIDSFVKNNGGEEEE